MSAGSETEMNRITDKPDSAFPREVFLDGGMAKTHCHMRVLPTAETTSLVSDVKAACEAVVGGGDFFPIGGTALLSQRSSGPGQMIHHDITLAQMQQLGEVHSCIATGPAGAKLWIQPPDGELYLQTIAPHKLFLFHGRLAHGGVAYTDRNVRVHFFVGRRDLLHKIKMDPQVLDTIDPYAADTRYELGW